MRPTAHLAKKREIEQTDPGASPARQPDFPAPGSFKRGTDRSSQNFSARPLMVHSDPRTAGQSLNECPLRRMHICLSQRKTRTSEMTDFWIFEDKPNKRVRIHRAGCGPRKGAGGPPLEGRMWHGPFASYAEAFTAAREMGRGKNDQINCWFCRPADAMSTATRPGSASPPAPVRLTGGTRERT